MLADHDEDLRERKPTKATWADFQRALERVVDYTPVRHKPVEPAVIVRVEDVMGKVRRLLLRAEAMRPFIRLGGFPVVDERGETSLLTFDAACEFIIPEALP